MPCKRRQTTTWTCCPTAPTTAELALDPAGQQIAPTTAELAEDPAKQQIAPTARAASQPPQSSPRTPPSSPRTPTTAELPPARLPEDPAEIETVEAADGIDAATEALPVKAAAPPCPHCYLVACGLCAMVANMGPRPPAMVFDGAAAPAMVFAAASPAMVFAIEPALAAELAEDPLAVAEKQQIAAAAELNRPTVQAPGSGLLRLAAKAPCPGLTAEPNRPVAKAPGPAAAELNHPAAKAPGPELPVTAELKGPAAKVQSPGLLAARAPGLGLLAEHNCLAVKAPGPCAVALAQLKAELVAAELHRPAAKPAGYWIKRKAELLAAELDRRAARVPGPGLLAELAEHQDGDGTDSSSSADRPGGDMSIIGRAYPVPKRMPRGQL